jgi:hypothetical protein
VINRFHPCCVRTKRNNKPLGENIARKGYLFASARVAALIEADVELMAKAASKLPSSTAGNRLQGSPILQRLVFSQFEGYGSAL